MKTAFASKVLLAAVVMGLAGCSSAKLMEKDAADLKAQVAKLQSDARSAHAAAEAAAGSAQSASQVAKGAQSSADQALAATQSSQACCNAVNQKVDNVFRQTISK